MKQHKVTFLPDKKTGYFDSGTSLRDAALELGIVIESSCGGAGTCGKCKVIIVNTALSDIKNKVLRLDQLEGDYKLSCRENISQDTICLIPEASRTIKEQIMTEGKAGLFPLNPEIKKIHLNVPGPKLGEKYFDIDAVVKSLSDSSISVNGYSHKLTSGISNILRESNYKVTAVVDSNRLIAVEPGDTTQNLYGIAVDIGTTTIAAKLLNINTGEVCAVASALNKQQYFGADIITRINYIIDNDNGLNTLHNSIIKQINKLTEDMCRSFGIKNSEIYKAVIAGNTVMQHICLKVDPRNLAFSPYTPVLQGPVVMPAKELNIKINNSGVTYFLPNLGGFVGSDITAVLTVLDLEGSEDFKLVIDLGTNGEIVLGSKGKIICASSPAGPAWEGACITSGMRAAKGAIESARINNGNLEITTIANAEPLGICGSGLHDLIVELLRAGIIDCGGRILSPEELPADSNDSLRRLIINNTNGSHDINIYRQRVILSQKDVREVQLAKAAISAGINILLKDLNTNAKQLSCIYVAGAFGNHLRGNDAIELGLLPEIEEEKIKFIGNAALSGAESVLLSKEARFKAEHLANTIEYVEISGREDFQEIFVNSMMFSKSF